MGEIQGRVEIKFDGSNWTDISTYVDWSRPFSMTCGRSDVYSVPQPGRLSGLYLDNTDGRFTVGNTSGAYTPNVRSGRLVRVSIKDPASATWYPRFTGRIDGWPLSWDASGNRCYVTINATDVLADLAKPYYYYENMIRALSTVESAYDHTFGQYHSLTQSTDGTQVDENPAGGGPSLKWSGTVEFTPPTESPSPLAMDKRPVMKNGYAYGTFVPNQDSWGFAAWVKCDGAGNTPLFLHTGGDVHTGFPGVGILFNSGAPTLQYWNSSGVNYSPASMTYTNNGGQFAGATMPNLLGKWLFITLSVAYGSDGTATAICYVYDGRYYGQWASYAETNANMLANTTAKTIRLGEPTASTVGHFYSWNDTTDSAWSSTTGLYAGFMPYQNNSNDDHTTLVSRIAGFAGVSVTNRLAPAGSERAQISGVASASRDQTALAAIQSIGQTAGAMVHAGRDGAIYYSQYRRIAATTPPVHSFSTDEIDDIEVTADVTRLVNTASANNRGGAYVQDRYSLISNVETESDSASISAIGSYPSSIETFLYRGFDYYPPSEANSLTGLGLQRWWKWRVRDLMASNEAIRVPNLTIDGLTLSNSQQLRLLQSEIWHRIRVTGFPSAGSLPLTYVTGWIEGWTETLSVREWKIKYNLSTAGSVVGTDLVGSAKAG